MPPPAKMRAMRPAPTPEVSLYETVLAALGGMALPVPKPPRPSASVVLWRRRAGQLEVYWIERAPTLAFMGGWHAFPGGALAKSDPEAVLLGEVAGLEGGPGPAAMPETVSEGFAAPPHEVPGIVACALRELLEEVGVLPVPALFDGGTDVLEPLGAARAQLLAGAASLAELAATHGLTLDASRLVFAGRWLTPPFGALRFDNRFFLLEWPAELPLQPEPHPGEAAGGEWVAPDAALVRWQRGEVIAAPPILHLLRVLAEDGPEVGLARLREPAEANLGPFRRIEFRPDLVMLPVPTLTLPPASYTNAFLLGREELVLVDPGSSIPAVIDRLEAAVRACAESGQRVSAIWLTHHHPDHVGGVAALAERLGLPVAAHRATAERLTPRGIRVDRELVDGECILLAGSPPFPLRVLHTPGHAKGHLCFLAEESGCLVAGDMLSTLSTIVIDPPEGDMDEYLGSLERLIALAPTTVFPAHGAPVRDGVAKLREFVAHRLAREKAILTAWQEGVREVAALRERVYADTPAAAAPLAERQIRAHLIRLERAGRLG
jgi:endoribonuclease LACTB2